MEELGVLAGKRRRALDSTVLDDAVARLDTITQLMAGIRRFGRDVPNGATLVAVHATGYDYTRAGKPEIARDDRDVEPAEGPDGTDGRWRIAGAGHGPLHPRHRR